MTIVTAEGALLEEILDLTYPVWHDGLTRRAYAQWNGAQQRTPWGRDHLRRVALVDERGKLLCSAKLYRHDARFDTREGGLCGVGAVFTPPALRRRGYASALIEQLVVRERERGALVAALFSEIGPAFYERLGFAMVPVDEVTLRVHAGAGAPAMLVRAGDERDLPALAALHETRSAGAAFALLRSPALMHHVLSRRRLFAGLSPPGRRSVEFHVAEEGASAVAYVVISVNAHGWTLEEAGDRDPAGARLGAMLQALIAREPSHRPPIIRSWWPASFPLPPQVDAIDRTMSREVLMLRPLGDVAVPSRAEEVFYWRGDVF